MSEVLVSSRGLSREPSSKLSGGGESWEDYLVHIGWIAGGLVLWYSISCRLLYLNELILIKFARPDGHTPPKLLAAGGPRHRF